MYLFTKSGALAGGGFQKVVNTFEDIEGKQVTEVNWYYTTSGGVVLSGWQTIGGKTYYFDEDDAWNPYMHYDCVSVIDGQQYLFLASGARANTGWASLDRSFTDDAGVSHSEKAWFYTDDGVVRTNWQKIDGKEYFFDDDGVMYSSTYIYYDGCYYLLGANGALASPGWAKLPNNYNGRSGQKWFYVLEDQTLAIGWQEIDNYYYYFYPEMYAGDLYWIDSQYEYFDASGRWVERTEGGNWQFVDGHLRYMENGSYVKGWKKIADNYYYFDSDCNLVENDFVESNGKLYFCGPAMYWGGVQYIWGDPYLFDNNGVHPSTVGCYQIADVVFRNFVKEFCQ